MEQDFGIRVDLMFDMGISAETYEEAVGVVKSIFEEQYNIVLKDEEIDNDRYKLLDGITCHLDEIDKEGFSNTKIVNVIKEIVEKIKGGL